MSVSPGKSKQSSVVASKQTVDEQPGESKRSGKSIVEIDSKLQKIAQAKNDVDSARERVEDNRTRMLSGLSGASPSPHGQFRTCFLFNASQQAMLLEETETSSEMGQERLDPNFRLHPRMAMLLGVAEDTPHSTVKSWFKQLRDLQADSDAVEVGVAVRPEREQRGRRRH